MSSDLIIRPTEIGDAAALKTALRAIWHHTYDPIIGHARVVSLTEGWHRLEKLTQEVRDPNICSLVVLDGAKIVGHVLIYPRARHELHLSRLYLAHIHHGKGVGKRLLEMGLAHFPKAHKVQLEVYEVNHKSVGFYMSQGFTVLSKMRDVFSDKEQYELIMERQLSDHDK